MLVTSYWIKHYTSGIIGVCFNMISKGIYHHRYDDLHYHFELDEETGSEVTVEDTEEKFEITKDELGKIEGVKYLVTELREKDQVIFYYIPYQLIEVTHKLGGI